MPEQAAMSTRLHFRSLPALNNLKGFEAAARLGSFRRAADELCVTHAAISHQVKQLETGLGRALFLREGRSVVLTPEGRVFYEYVRKGMEQLLTGVNVIRRTLPDSELRIETYITVAIRWLSHMLPRFRARHPDIAFSVNTRRTEWWFDEANTDVAILYLDRELPASFREYRLFDGVLFPVCSPALMQELGNCPEPGDLIGFPLLAVSSAPDDWPSWFEAADVDDISLARYQKVDTYALALEMAADGEGIAMINGPFAEDALGRGELVRPLPIIAHSPGYWAVIFRADRADDPKIRAFITWLCSEVSA